ncbi:MAG: AI-2E family transporter [Armatimonadetes bacterium]|nr:AI-2E family transporter [Armatimonadota bacterium]
MAFLRTDSDTPTPTAEAVAAVVLAQREATDNRWRTVGGLLLRGLLIAICAYVLWRVRTILTTVIIAGVLASAAGALVEPLTRFRIRFLSPKTQRVITTAFVFILLFGGLFLTVNVMLRPFQNEWVQLKTNWPRYQVALESFAVQAKVWFQGLPPDVQKFLNGLRENSNVPSPTTWLGNLLGATLSWASHVVELILVPVLAFYFTVDGRALRSELLFFVPKGRLRSTMAILNRGGAIMRSYIVAQFWLAVIAGLAVGLGLQAFGIPYALILGIIAGVTRAIPVIGPLLGGIPVMAITFLYGAQSGNPYLWVGVLIAFTVLHLVESKVLMPHILGHHLELHAVIILIALLIGGEFFGLMGMFLAAPLAAFARVMIMHFFVIPRRRKEKATRQVKDTVPRTVTPVTVGDGVPVRVGSVEISSGERSGLRLERALRADRESRRTTAPKVTNGDAA